ncbi:uncharacterized protein [Clytia hemisphaerica]|uniref:uncharacterized protein n=1 Tax=Clytia hemisphaerica TaxID=252671 RepID=UPI0034D6C64E
MMTSSENVTTSIRIRQKPPRRRKSADESVQQPSEKLRMVHSPGGVYYLQQKSVSRSLDDLISSDDKDNDVIMVNGSPSSDAYQTGLTVKSAAVIRLTGGKEEDNHEAVSKTKEELIGDRNNNSVAELTKPHNEKRGPYIALLKSDGDVLNDGKQYQQKRKMRNKSTSDVIDEDDSKTFSIQHPSDVSASVDNIYENGLYTKLMESDTETLDGSSLTLSSRSSSKSRPPKPKRSNASLNRTFDYDRARILPPLDIGDEEVSKYHRELNTSLDEHNNLSMSKENFEAFISREKKKYSGQVSNSGHDTTFPSDEENSDISRSRVHSWGSDSANMSQRSFDLVEQRIIDESKVKEIGEVLDSQLHSLETLLSTSAPPRRSSASYRSRSVENISEKKRLSAIEETHSRNNSRRNMNRLSYDVLSDKNYVEPQNRKTLPKVPQRPTSLKDRMKSLKRSLSLSRKRIVKKSGRNIEFPAIRKSIRLPNSSKSMRPRKRSVSLKDISQRKNSNGVLNDDQNVVLRREVSARRLFPDNRSSRVIAHECDVMKTQLAAERQKVGIFKCFTSYFAHDTRL